MQAPITHILPLTVIRRERLLPIPGKILVRKGQKVVANDIIAEAELAPKHLILDVCRGLGLSPEQADKEIKVRMGDEVEEGDVLAGPVGMTRRVIRSPGIGRIVVVESGQILIALTGKPFALKAGMPGEVQDLIADRGAIIETTGALIQGVWGNGQIDSGVLHVLAKNPANELTPDHMDPSMRGSVIMAGYVEKAEVLKMAADIPLKGMVLASMHAGLIPLAQKLPFPLILIEGFGDLSMNPAAFQLLETSEGRDTTLKAEAWNALSGARPEIIIPLPAPPDTGLPKETDVYKVGQQVRVLREPFFGQVGTITFVEDRVEFPSGVRATGASIRFEDGSSEMLPLANLEVLA